MQKWKKITIGIVGSLLVLVLFSVIISYFILRNSLPDYDGEFRAHEIKSSVTVLRDSFAIPMIIGQSDEDIAFVLGFVHAQERLFQMDIARRAGEGRLSEIFGEKTIPFDKMFRTVGVYRNVKENFEKLNPLTKKILIAYTKGVNAYINEAKGNYAPEFDLLGYDPYEWEPEHSLVIAKLMAWELNLSWWSDIAFASIVQKLGEEKAKEILPNYPENAPTIIPKDIAKFAEIPLDFIQTDREFRKFTGFIGTHIGSNNWVVNGNKSESGKPIIANDPHLAFTAPGKWFFAILRGNEWHAEGFTLPGLPGIVIGKNQNISWVMTNVMADDADFYLEQLDSSKTKYFLDGAWKDLTIVKDSFSVKNSKKVVFEIKKNHRGPIISNIHPYNVFYPDAGPEKLDISMRWTGLEFSDELFAAISYNKAKDWNEFKEAVKYFTVPGQNFVYADDKGNIGYICAAKLPIRNSNNPTLIYDGKSTKNDWLGFVSYDQMPKLYNPKENFIASANNKTIENFPFHISNVWEPPSRIQRINQLLTSKQKLSSKDFEKYQMDFKSPYAEFVTQKIISAFQNVKINDGNLKLALDLLNNWDFVFDANSQVPTIYTRFLNFLIINTFEDELGKDLLKEYVFLANVPYRKIQEILEGDSSFFDDVNTPAIETKNDIIRKSLLDAVKDLEKEKGVQIKNWQWGNVHSVTFKHMFNGEFSVLDRMVNIGPFELGGDGTTIFNTEYSFHRLIEDENGPLKSKPYENILGPSMRYIFDFAEPDYLKFILPTGQSGYFMSQHYNDMTNMWLKGKFIKIPLTEDEFQKRTIHTLKFIRE